MYFVRRTGSIIVLGFAMKKLAFRLVSSVSNLNCPLEPGQNIEYDMAVTRTICSASRSITGTLSTRLSILAQTQPAKAVRLSWGPCHQSSQSRRYFAMSGAARYQLKDKAQLVIQQGDITQWEGDAIVNAGVPAVTKTK